MNKIQKLLRVGEEIFTPAGQPLKVERIYTTGIFAGGVLLSLRRSPEEILFNKSGDPAGKFERAMKAAFDQFLGGAECLEKQDHH